MAKEKEELKPLTEGALHKAILALQKLAEEYAALDKKWDFWEAQVLATMPPKDVRQYGDLRCCIVQAHTRRIDWKKECLALARLIYPKAKEFREFLIQLVKTYRKKANKPSVKLTVVKTEVKA